LPEFVEFAGKKPYKCPKCKVEIRYAKFFGSDKKLLTTDGKEPNKTFGRGSNTGWPTDPVTKQMHECSTGISTAFTPITTITNFDDSSSVTVVHNSQPLTDMDEKVRDRIIEDAYLSAKFLIWKLEGVEKACKELGIELGPQSGMVFNQVCAEDRSLKEK